MNTYNRLIITVFILFLVTYAILVTDKHSIYSVNTYNYPEIAEELLISQEIQNHEH